MNIKTGQTVYEIVFSLDVDNNPITSGVTFANTFFVDGIVNTGITLNTSLASVIKGAFSTSWSAATFGTYQYELINNITNVVFISDIYNVKPDNQVDTSPTIYVGL